MILHGIEYQRPTSLNMRIMADHVTYSFLSFMKSIFPFCLGCYCGGYSQNRRSNLSSSNRTWPFCQSNCTLVSPGHRNDKSYLFLPNYRCKRHSVVCLALSAAMFPFPLCIEDRSGRLIHDLSKNYAGHQRVQNYVRSQLGCGID